MDADLQHDESLLPKMLEMLQSEPLDTVIGSRFAGGGDFASMPTHRVKISALGNRLARLVVKAELTDPMSGFFCCVRFSTRRCGVCRLRATSSWSISSLPSPSPLVFKELAFTFRERLHGESKLDTLIALEYLQLLVDKLIGHIVPVRFVFFAAISALGLLVHLSVLAVSLKLFGLAFAAAH
jgi:dolichol-phosphate mannosyltransferase